MKLDQSLILSLVFGVNAFLLDRVHKYVQLEWFGWSGGEVVRVTEFFDYVLVWNTGVSYGLLSDVPVAALGVLMAGAIIALAVWWTRAKEPLIRIGLALAIGGALSNAIDRLLYGAVADFFHFHLGAYSFYIFNIADAAISFGVLLLFLDMLGVGRGKTAQTQ